MTFYDLCCGTGALTLRLLSPYTEPLPMMGCKADFSTSVLDLMGIRGRRPDHVVMADCGPWGEFWRVVAEQKRGGHVANAVEHGWARWLKAGRRAWEPTENDREDTRPDGEAVYAHLAMSPPPANSVEFAAAFACLQTANASGRAVQTDGRRWITHGYAHLSDTARLKRFPERLRKQQVAERVRQIAGLDWPPVEVHTHDLRHCLFAPVSGDVVVIDPPYRETTGYHVLDLGRGDVAYLARMAAARGARVGVCEGEQVEELASSGWFASQVIGGSWRKPKSEKVEWLTTSFPTSQPEQLSLGGGL